MDLENENGENAKKSPGKKTRGHLNNKWTSTTIIHDPVKKEMVTSTKKRRNKPRIEKKM